jgi:glycosidase
LNGITARLDSIKALGINTIWLMPIYPIGILKSIGSPYCVSDYTAVNPNYGSLTDLRNLVTQAHNRNMAVILDWVGNDTSWDNAWISNKSWYTQDANGNIISPVGTTWTDVADLNYNNMDMRAAMIKAMKFWVLTANIDGFRCDAADYIPFDFWQQAIDTLQNMQGRTLILLAEGDRSDHFTAGFQMDYAWNFLATLKNVFINNEAADSLFATNAAEYVNVPAGKRKLRFTTNHDESGIATPIQLFNGKDAAIAASVITICMQGVPLLYCGQEVGVSNPLTYSTQRPINWTQNPDMLSTYKQILEFYNTSDALRKGVLQEFDDPDVVVFTKQYLNQNVLVIVNTRNRSLSFTLPSALTNSTWMNVLNHATMTFGSMLSSSPYQYWILTK